MINTRHITTSERSNWNAKETPQGAQQKTDQAEQNAKSYADQQVRQLAQNVLQNTQDIANVSQDLDAHLEHNAQ